jgi:hypothetical protein
MADTAPFGSPQTPPRGPDSLPPVPLVSLPSVSLVAYAPALPPVQEGRATLSLVLGALSLVTCGFTGIPAVVLGFTARTAIRRSSGRLRGAGLATAGIATGVLGSTMALVAMAAFVAGLLFSTHEVAGRKPILTPSPGSTTAWVHAAPATPEPMVIGAIRVTDIDPNITEGFHRQLADEFRRAARAHQTVVVMTSAKWCGVCKEFQAALPDPRMQAALANVDLVRVDVDDFDVELHEAGMLEKTLPWFYKVDASLLPVDAISAGEWDENVADNMAPVLRSFLAGSLRSRRDPSGMGGGTLL